MSDWFKEVSKTVVPYLNIEARFDEAPDQGFLSKKGGRGFPYVTLMDTKGTVVWEMWPADKKAVDKAIKSAQRVVALHEKHLADPKNEAAKANYMLYESFGRSQRTVDNVDELEKLAMVKGLDSEVLAEWKMKLVDRKIEGAYSNTRTVEARGEALLKLYKEGVIPADDARVAIGYYYF